MSDENVNIKCPHCKYEVMANLATNRKLVVYVCPKCESNVAYFEEKIRVVSDSLIEDLVETGLLETGGELIKDKKPGKDKTKSKRKSKKKSLSNGGNLISRDDILNLRILLETEKDIKSLISKL